jgi:hypothetical protein
MVSQTIELRMLATAKVEPTCGRLSAEVLAVHEWGRDVSGNTNCRRASSTSTCSDLSRLLGSEFSCDEFCEDVDVYFDDIEMRLRSVLEKGAMSNAFRCENKHTAHTNASSLAITTMVVGNIPPQYTAEMLLEEWQNAGTYDMIYLPVNGAQNRNAGFVFINFTSPAAALDFSASWKNRRLAHFSAKMRKALWVSPSQVQGRSGHLEILLGKRSAKARQGAVLFDPSSGERITLEAALALN